MTLSRAMSLRYCCNIRMSTGQEYQRSQTKTDTDRIFRTITKDAAMNISLADVQQKIDQLISSSQLHNKLFQGMDSYYVLSDSIQENNGMESVMESIKATKGKVTQIVVIKWFINLVK